MTEKNTAWQYDELQQVGTDYGKKEIAEKYESIHSKFRDMELEAEQVIDALGIMNSNFVIDFGAGTGTFALLAAKHCAKVHAVDVSAAMVDCASSRAKQQGISNIEFHVAGFLTYEHKEPPVDCIVTTLAFHHLPDFWKGIALKRMNVMLKPGGLLYMHDVIIEEQDACDNIALFIDALSVKGGQPVRKGTEVHFREEFSTYDWVLDGMFARAGFSIRSKNIDGGVLGTYICEKK